MEDKSILIFGAGKIGRSFIGQLFSRGGYEVVFVDINKQLIKELNLRQGYKVDFVSDDSYEEIKINNVKGVCLEDEDAVIQEIEEAGIVAVSVGKGNLSSISPVLAKGLLQRFQKGKRALDIIIAENVKDADLYFIEEFEKLLPDFNKIREMVGLVETCIGKMVPFIPPDKLGGDILKTIAEPYNKLIAGENSFKNPIPKVEGLVPKKNIKAWVDRKLFIHNLGHAVTAYLGYIHCPNFVFLYEALSVSSIYEQVRDTMVQASDILLKKYPAEFTKDQLLSHIDDLLLRFQNKALGDTIYRVGCDLMRKLGSNDRFVGAIKDAIAFAVPYDKILYALVCGCHFNAKGQNGQVLDGDSEFKRIYQEGLQMVLVLVCGFDATLNPQLFKDAESVNNHIKLTCLTYNKYHE